MQAHVALTAPDFPNERPVQVAVNGKAQNIRRSVRKEGQVFTVSLGAT